MTSQIERARGVTPGLSEDYVNKGWADQRTVEQLKESIRAWAEHPDAFFANVHVEVIGWRPG